MLTVIVASAVATVLATSLAVRRTLDNPLHVRGWRAMLEALDSTELGDYDSVLARTDRRGRSWSAYWYDAVTVTGRVTTPAGPGRVAALVAAVPAVLVSVTTANPLGGMLVGVAALAVLRAALSRETAHRLLTLETQLPGLLAALRAHLHAGSTIHQALEATASDQPAPLGDEMRRLVADTTVGVPLTDALHALSGRVPSREIQFLAASIDLAVRSGADLGPQLQVIEGILRQRTRIRAKLRVAVAQVTPTKYLALGAPPFILGYFAVTNPDSNRILLHTATGQVIAAICALLYAAGYLTIRAMVTAVERS